MIPPIETAQDLIQRFPAKLWQAADFAISAYLVDDIWK